MHIKLYLDETNNQLEYNFRVNFTLKEEKPYLPHRK